jgi:hypothetical protein
MKLNASRGIIADAHTRVVTLYLNDRCEAIACVTCTLTLTTGDIMRLQDEISYTGDK